jgi:CRP/FNR family transcriptional regulator, cyclic AMP receptor protein
MASLSTVRLLDVEPDIGRFLTAEERAAVLKLVSVPVATVLKGEFTLFDGGKPFAALVLEGMLFQRLRVGDHVALRLLGPGDIVSAGGTLRSTLLTGAECRAASSTEVALLGDEVLVAARRWPQLMAGLHLQIAEQFERLAIQMVICQLPRVDQRLLALMWLLAESWGRVTPAGTVLPLSLTHEALGELIGARRPTVTLALMELGKRGAIVKADGGWLLLESLLEPVGEMARIVEPRLLDEMDRIGEPRLLEPSGSASVDEQQQVGPLPGPALGETIDALQQRRRAIDRCRDQIGRVAASRGSVGSVSEFLWRQAP